MAFVSSFAVPAVTRRPRSQPGLTSTEQSFVARPRQLQLRLSRCRAAQFRAHMGSTCMDDITAPSDSTPSPISQPPRLPTGRNGTALAAALAGAATIFAIVRRSGISSVLSRLAALATELGVARGAALIAGINFCTVLFCFPANMGLMIGAGAVLGAFPAFLALFVSKVAAACVAFLLAKSVLYDRVRRWLSRYPKMSRVLLESGKEGGWKFVVLMRLSPFPGFLLNYLLSLTGLTFMEFTLGTLVGTAPSVINLVLMGATARDVGVGAAGGAVQGGWFGFAFKALCMLSMVIVSVVITRRARKAFAELEDDADIPAQEKSIGT